MQITRTTIQDANPDLERGWSARHTDPHVHSKWVAEIMVDPINRDPKVMKLYGTTTYPNGAVERFTQE